MVQSDNPSPATPALSAPAPSCLARAFGIDSRSLVLFRIGLGVILLLDTILRARDLKAHYTDSGVLPRHVWLDLFGNTGTWSLHLFSGDTGWVTALFLVTGLAAVGLIIGWHTRIMAVLGWLLLLSVNFRNPLISNNGDTLLVVLLMWSILLPIGLFGAFDALPRRPDQRKTRLVLRGATVGVLLQIVVAYFVTGYTKLTDPWLEGAALEQALSIGTFQTDFGVYLLDYPRLLQWTTYSVPWFEMLVPALALIPTRRGRIRLAVVALFVVFHIGIALTLSVGWFSLVSILAWMLFLPPIFWDWFERRSWIMAPFRWVVDRLRWLFGRFVAHPYPVSPTPVRRVADAVSLALIAFVFVMAAHVCGVWIHGRPLVSDTVQRIAYALDLGQRWTQFSIPTRTHGWFVLPVEFRDGTKIDVLTGKPFDTLANYQPPDRVSDLYPNYRWRKYFSNLGGDQFKPFRVQLPYAVAHLATPYETGANPIVFGEAHYIRVTYDEDGDEQRKAFEIFRGNLPYIPH